MSTSDARGAEPTSVRAARWLVAAQARYRARAERGGARGAGDRKEPTIREAARLFKCGKSQIGRHVKSLRERGVPDVSHRPPGRPRTRPEGEPRRRGGSFALVHSH